MGIKISELTPDANISGVELIPVSDNGAAKSVTTGGIKEFTIATIESIAAAAGVDSNDSIYILTNGEIKPVDIESVAQHVINKLLQSSQAVSVSGSDMLPIRDGSGDKVVTAANLAAYIGAAVKSTALDVSGLDSATLGTGDFFLVNQDSTPKKTTLGAINNAIYGALANYVSNLSAATTPNNADVFYVLKSGTPYSVTLATLKTVMGSAIAPATTTENRVPQWSSAQKTLKDGLTVRGTIRAAIDADDNSIPTEKAVRVMMDDPLNTISNESGAVAFRYGNSPQEGLITVVVDSTLNIAKGVGIPTPVDVCTIPKNAIIRSVQSNNIEVVESKFDPSSGSTTSRIGIGIDGDPTKFGLLHFTLNYKGNKMLTPQVLVNTINVKVFPCKTNGDSGDFGFSAGKLRLRIIYDALDSLDDAE